VIERAVILASEGPILRQHLIMASQRQSVAQAHSHSHGLEIRVGMTVAEAERVLIQATLERTKGNKTRAAAILGISTKTLHGKLKLFRMVEQAAKGKAS